MKIRKIGRARPILYRGKFNVPLPVIKRLTTSKNHYLLAGITNFNGKIDQYYLTIDNILSAIILAKEGNLTTTDHRIKIKKFYNHLNRRAGIRSIGKEDFYGFYDLWSRSRYRLFFPRSYDIEKIELFAQHLLEFSITEIARYFKSDETILSKKVEELLKIYRNEAMLEEVEHIHEYHQMEAESIGELYGGKLIRKFLNPWNFIDVSILSDRKNVDKYLDNSDEIHSIFADFLKTWDQLVDNIQSNNFNRIVSEITNEKIKKHGIDEQIASKEAIEAASIHPEVQRFRLSLNITYDSSGPRRTVQYYSKMMKAALDQSDNPNKPILTGWEIFKKYS